MPQPTKIPVAFADSGDKNSIPQSTVTPGLASWSIGFPPITSTPFANGGLAPKRADFNGIFNALSAAAIWQQQGGVFAYDNATDYEVGNVVVYNNDLYKCLAANGPNSTVKAPTDTTVWDKIAAASTLTDVERVSASAAGKLKLSDGTMLLWGSATGSSSDFVQVTFAEAFYDNNFSIATQYRSSLPPSINGSKSLRVAFVADSATTGFKFSIPTLTGTSWGFSIGRLDWLAIGRWKA